MLTFLNPARYGHFPTMYVCDLKDIDALPRIFAIYFLCDGVRIYCGYTKRANKRPKESSWEQRFGGSVACVTEDMLSILGKFKNIDHKIRVFKRLESECISALCTLIYGNCIPITLHNDRDAVLLPPEAWTVEKRDITALAIEMVRSALYGFGIPAFMTEMPYYPDLIMNSHVDRTLYNEERWPKVMMQEFSRRRGLNFGSDPVVLLDPRS